MLHAHAQVIELMQKVLGETPSQIKETVKRDRCDWLAAIYNLLMDQPEGRNVLQRLVQNYACYIIDETVKGATRIK